jgi:cytochrome c biogenesis protein CcmG/thiol:disulfide interchange protein DsbE
MDGPSRVPALERACDPHHAGQKDRYGMDDPSRAGQPRWLWGMSWPAIGLALVAVAVAAHGHWVRPGASDRPAGPAPAVTLRTFAGEAVRLADLRGRPVVVNFWASWSEDARAEAPRLERLWREYRGRGLAMLGVAIHEQPTARDPDQNPRAFARRFGLTYPVGHDRSGEISHAFGVTGVPETVLIAPDGEIVFRSVGLLDEAALRRALAALLAEPGGASAWRGEAPIRADDG